MRLQAIRLLEAFFVFISRAKILKEDFVVIMPVLGLVALKPSAAGRPDFSDLQPLGFFYDLIDIRNCRKSIFHLDVRLQLVNT
jgi:hypothetical protein